jgi:phytoene dehydrogenase-like protein
MCIRDRIFPAGATLISGFEPGGLHTWVYERLGLTHRAQPLARAMEVVADDRRFSVWTDRERFDDELRNAFPRHARGRVRLVDWAERIGGVVHRMAGRLPVLPPHAPRDVLRLAGALRPETVLALPYLARTVGGVMRSFDADRDRAFAQFIDAQLLDATGCTARDCAALSGAIALDLYHRGCYSLPGGPAEIARDIVRSVRRDGGELHFETAVIALRRDGGGWQVRTADGERVAARAVVSNVPAWDMPALLGAVTPARLRRAERLREHGWGAFLLHAALDPRVVPDDGWAYYQTLPPLGAALTEGQMCFISVLPARRSGAPRAVSVSTHTEVDGWWGLSQAAYRERKARYEGRLLAACERALPGFRSGLVWARSATPRTFAHYTLRGGGVVGGVRNDRRHALFGALSHRSGLAGLFLAGDSVFPGQGTIGVTLSGINAWRSVRDEVFDKQSFVRGFTTRQQTDSVEATRGAVAPLPRRATDGGGPARVA